MINKVLFISLLLLLLLLFSDLNVCDIHFLKLIFGKTANLSHAERLDHDALLYSLSKVTSQKWLIYLQKR